MGSGPSRPVVSVEIPEGACDESPCRLEIPLRLVSKPRPGWLYGTNSKKLGGPSLSALQEVIQATWKRDRHPDSWGLVYKTKHQNFLLRYDENLEDALQQAGHRRLLLHVVNLNLPQPNDNNNNNTTTSTVKQEPPPQDPAATTTTATTTLTLTDVVQGAGKIVSDTLRGMRKQEGDTTTAVVKHEETTPSLVPPVDGVVVLPTSIQTPPVVDLTPPRNSPEKRNLEEPTNEEPTNEESRDALGSPLKRRKVLADDEEPNVGVVGNNDDDKALDPTSS